MRLWPVLLAGLWLGGCVAPSPQTASPYSPEQHQQLLEQIETWRLRGRIAIVNGSEAWNLNMEWQQRDGDYHIELWGPFGSGRVQLVGNGQGVRLVDAGQQIYYASDPESLLYEHTRVKMPVSGLRYWILGLTAPQYESRRVQRDAAGRLATVQQEQWQITFKRYSRVKGLDLPDRLAVDRQDLQVKLVVDNWQVNTSSP